jgi:phosphatidylinositol glycan class Z
MSALAVALLHILYDTWYYSSRLWPAVIVPMNAALYNLKTDNLASHGLHPRWLHVIVNAPMILGITPWLHCLSLAVSVFPFGQKKTKNQGKTGTRISKGE